MKHDLQEYYEGLVAVQSDSIKRFLSRHGLMRYAKAFLWLDESDRKYIINGFDKGIKLRADYVFNKLRKTYKIQQQKESPVPPVKQQQKKYCIEFKPLNIELQHSELLFLQEYCVEAIKSLSGSSRKVLSANEIFGIEQMLPYIKGEKRLAELLKNAPNRKTKIELYRMLRLIRQEVEEARTPRKQVASIDLSKNKEQQDVFGGASAESKLEASDNRQLTGRNAVDLMEMLFVEWQNKISVRSRNILKTNGVTCYKELKTLSDKKNFSFMDLNNCGAKSAKELMEMVTALKELDPQTIDSVDKEKLNNLERKLNSFHLSTRTRHFLKEANVETIGDLVSFNRDDVLKFKHIGRKTIYELDVFLEGLGLSFGMNLTVCPHDNKANDVIDPILVLFSNKARAFAAYFKEKHGHLPMIYLLYERLNSLIEYEEEIFKLYYGISDTISLSYDKKTNSDKSHSSLSIDEIAKKYYLTSAHVRQILVKAQKRFVNAAKLLRNHNDWCYYGLDKNFLFVWNVDNDLQYLLSLEDSELKKYLLETFHTEQEVSLLSEEPNIDEYLFKILLIGCDMSLYWIDPERIEIHTSFAVKESGLSNKKIKPNELSARNILLINSRFDSFKFNKAVKEVFRLYKVKTEDNILIPIKSCFVDNSDFWSSERKLTDNEKISLECLLTNLFKEICDAHIDNGNLFVKANKTDYGQLAYEILKIAGKRLHRDDLFTRLNKVCEEKGLSVLVDPLRFSAFLSKDSRIIPYGKSSFWGLKEWGEITGSIREIAIEIVRKSRIPIPIEELAKIVLLQRPDSNEKSVVSTIRQAGADKGLMIFYGDYAGYPKRKYSEEYILMPQTFDEWLQAFKAFVLKNKRFPYSGDGYEGFLYRWHFRGAQFTNLSSDEILKLDALDRELALFPQNATEYNFLQNCNLYKKFVESNKRMLTQNDDIELFNWFYKTSRNYGNYDDNRNKYFTQLLQYTSKLLY